MEGKKFDQGKPSLGLVPGIAIREIAKVLDRGAEKYDRYNWAKGMEWSRLYDAALRHIYDWIDGLEKDEETNLMPLAHAACDLIFLIVYEKLGLGEDDRYKMTIPEAPTCELGCYTVDADGNPSSMDNLFESAKKKG